jgi:hypothetical protein
MEQAQVFLSPEGINLTSKVELGLNLHHEFHHFFCFNGYLPLFALHFVL